MMDYVLFGRLAEILVRITNRLIIRVDMARSERQEEANRLAQVIDHPPYFDDRHPLPDDRTLQDLYIAAIVQKVLDPILSGQTPVALEKALRRAEIQWSTLANPTFERGQQVRPGRWQRSEEELETMMRRTGLDVPLRIMSAENVNPDPSDPSIPYRALHHHQRIKVAKESEGTPVFMTYIEMGDMLLIGWAKAISEASWIPGHLFEPIALKLEG